MPKLLWLSVLLAVVLGLLVGLTVGAMFDQAADVAFPTSAACSIAALWMAAVQARMVLRCDPLRAFDAAMGAAGASPFVAVGVWIVHGEPRWVDSAQGEICGGVVPPGPAFALAVLVFGVLFAERFARILRVAVRPLLGVLVVVVTVLSVLGLVRGARLPTTQHPLDGLPVLGEFRVAEGANHPVGDVFLSFQCAAIERGATESGCSVWLRPTPERREAASPATSLRRVALGSTVQVLRDRRHDLWIVRTPALHFPPEHVAAFRGPALTRVDLSLRDFPGEFAPPPGWSVAGLLGVVLAGWVIFRARLAEPLPPGRLVDAMLWGDSTMRFADGGVLPAPPSHAGYVGMVVVALPPTEGAPYRQGPSPSVVRPGTLVQWADAFRGARDVRCALALSALVLFGTPLGMAAVLRLLW